MNAAILFPLARILAIFRLDDASELALERYRRLMPNERNASIDRSSLPKEKVSPIGTRVDFEGILRSLPPVRDDELPPAPMLSADANATIREALASGESSQWKTTVEHLLRGRLQDAAAALQTIRTENYKWLRDYLDASVHVWLGDFDRAGEIATRPSLASRSDPMVQILRSEIFQHLSLSYFSRLLETYPDSCLAHFVKAQNLAEQENAGAEDEFRKALASCPERTQIRIALADFYLANSKYQEALKECQDELDVDPYSVSAKMRIGRIYIQLRDPQRGMPFLREALEVDPEDVNGRTYLARGYELIGQWEKAIEEYRRSLDDDPSLNRIHYVLGRLYRRLGNEEFAKREYKIFQANEAKEREQHVNRIQQIREREAGEISR